MAYGRGHPPQGYSHKVLTQVDFDDHHDHYLTYLEGVLSRLGAGQAAFNPGAVGRIYFCPVDVEFTLTIDRLGFVIAASAGNIRMAIYADNDYTPQGGALVVETASEAAGGGNQKQELTIADTQLTPGIYWIAFMADDTGIGLRGGTYRSASGGSIVSGIIRNNFGGYAAFEDPCGALGNQAVTPIFFARVASVP